MIAQCVLGFLALFTASGLSLHKHNQKVQPCEYGDCHAENAAVNHSQGRIECECCWRDCDFNAQDMQDLHLEQGKGRAILEDAKADVDAWIIANAPELAPIMEYNRYTPILETVKIAVESEGSVASIVGPNDLDTVIAGVKAAVSNGKKPLVFTVAHEFWRNRVPYALSKMKEAKDAGAYLVSYNGEPGFEADGTELAWAEDKALKMAEEMGADEVWDYTVANVKHYPRRSNSPIIRFVPPGYVQKLDVGVNMNSKSIKAGMVGYMGNKKFKTMSGHYFRALAGHVYETNEVWSNDDLRTYLETYPIQLNQHRWQTCCPRAKWEAEYQHFESFRMSTLLANKACVVSGPSADEDMKVWKGVVHFAEVEDTTATIERLRQNLAECRNNTYETYKRDFDPKAILSNAGFFKAWRPPHGI